MTFFLAGIMQGSHLGKALHSQSYRDLLREILERHVPGAEVFCPFNDHRNSLDYGDDHGRRVFIHHIEQAARADVVVAYLPEASMGTAVEMWAAHQAGKLILSITPLERNWVVKFLSDAVFHDLEHFERSAQSGELVQLIDGKLRQ